MKTILDAVFRVHYLVMMLAVLDASIVNLVPTQRSGRSTKRRDEITGINTDGNGCAGPDLVSG